MNEFDDFRFETDDGLKLHGRDYGNPEAPLTLLCLHGLTRNIRDFEGFCEHFAPHYHIVAVEQRGRGESDYDANPDKYQLPVYVKDTLGLIEQRQLENLVLVGTSMGGLMSMVMAAMHADKFIGLVLNDIGPQLEPGGLDRIKEYVGQAAPVHNWHDAAHACANINAAAFPDFTEEDWLNFARRTYRQGRGDALVPAYDPNIAIPIIAQDPEAVPDLWPVFDAITSLPILVVRGELSDVISSDCVAEMRRRKPDLRYVEIPKRGHAPILDEPEAVAAIGGFLGHLATSRL